MAKLKAAPNRIADIVKDTEKQKNGQLQLPALRVKQISVWIVGDSELICNRKTDEALEQILGRQTSVDKDKEAEKLTKRKRPPRDPDAEYKRSLYAHPDGGFAFPGSALKKAMVEGSTSIGKTVMPKTFIRQVLFVRESLIPIKGTPHMRKDGVKLKGSGGTDVRFRAGFKEWAMNFTIRYNSSAIGLEEVLVILNTAGFAVGIGDWRPEKSGSHGQFHVEKVHELD